MIGITKTADVPASLNSKTTVKRRNEIIQAGQYPSGSKLSAPFTAKHKRTYDSRYRHEDIKKRLTEIYHDKCAYCECRDRRLQVEHYRPKSIYYWLAYSWDNLLFACSACNSSKSDGFEIEGERITAPPVQPDSFHNLSQDYNQIEKPCLLNPEDRNDAELFDQFKFGEDGSMTSEHPRCAYTISLCKLNEERTVRKWRYQVLEKLEKRIKADIVSNNNSCSLECSIDIWVSDFIRQSQNQQNEFLAFRQYAVKHFLQGVIEKILT